MWTGPNRRENSVATSVSTLRDAHYALLEATLPLGVTGSLWRAATATTRRFQPPAPTTRSSCCRVNERGASIKGPDSVERHDRIRMEETATSAMRLAFCPWSTRSLTMKAFSAFAVLALAIAGCSYHKETVVQRPTPTSAVVVPDSPPPPTRTVVVPSDY
jgi:hypothetical protein